MKRLVSVFTVYIVKCLQAFMWFVVRRNIVLSGNNEKI